MLKEGVNKKGKKQGTTTPWDASVDMAHRCIPFMKLNALSLPIQGRRKTFNSFRGDANIFKKSL